MISNISPDIAHVYTAMETTPQSTFCRIILCNNGNTLIIGLIANAKTANKVIIAMYAPTLLYFISIWTPVLSLKIYISITKITKYR